MHRLMVGTYTTGTIDCLGPAMNSCWLTESPCAAAQLGDGSQVGLPSLALLIGPRDPRHGACVLSLQVSRPGSNKTGASLPAGRYAGIPLQLVRECACSAGSSMCIAWGILVSPLIDCCLSKCFQFLDTFWAVAVARPLHMINDHMQVITASQLVGWIVAETYCKIALWHNLEMGWPSQSGCPSPWILDPDNPVAALYTCCDLQRTAGCPHQSSPVEVTAVHAASHGWCHSHDQFGDPTA